MNSFPTILFTANTNNWCLNPECSTCRAMEFKNALADLSRTSRCSLSQILTELNFSELRQYENWGEAIRIAVDEINNPQEMDEVLNSWLLTLENNIRLADIILFYFVRRGALFAPMGIETHTKWTRKCIELAISSQDNSLIESLIYTLGDRIAFYADLVKVVRAKSQSNLQIKRALINSGITTH